jgi:hypothetical protein
MPSIRELERNESNVALAQREAAATVTRFTTLEPMLERLPEDYKHRLLDQVLNPPLLLNERESVIAKKDHESRAQRSPAINTNSPDDEN